MFGVEGLDTVSLIIISVSVVFLVTVSIWFIVNRGAYKRSLKHLVQQPKQPDVITRTIDAGRDFYFDQHMYAQLPPNSRLQKMSLLSRMRQGNPYHFDVQIRNEMVARAAHNYDRLFPHLTPDEQHKSLPRA